MELLPTQECEVGHGPGNDNYDDGGDDFGHGSTICDGGDNDCN